MQTEATFAGWDFASPTWLLTSGINNNYPYLSPPVQATALAFSGVTDVQMTISWTNGNESKRVVFVKQASSGTALPENNIPYTADAVFGNGTQIGTSEWFCVYNGTGTNVTVTGLTATTDYIYQVFEYTEGCAANNQKYNTLPAFDNPNIQPTDVSPAVEVTATDGDSGPTQYTTLKNAFDKINDGTHKGDITVEIFGNTTETATASLYGSGYGSAEYASVTVYPTVAGLVVSSPVQPAIELLDASNVTIDGSLNGLGTTRDLTFRTTDISFPDVIRIASNTPDGFGGDTIKNCIIQGSSNSSGYAISIVGANVSGAYFEEITIRNNQISQANYGIMCYALANAGGEGDRFSVGSLLNIIDNDMNTADGIFATGIYIEGVSGGVVYGNNIGNFDKSLGNDDRGIFIGEKCSDMDVFSNEIYNLGNEAGGGYGGIGIAIATDMASANIKIHNNLIYNITGDGYFAGEGSGWPSDNPMGIWAYSEVNQSGIRIYFNSIHLYGGTLTYGDNIFSAGIVVDGNTGADIRNNNIVNTMYSSNGKDANIYGVFLNNLANKTLDYNNYYVWPTGEGTGTPALGYIDGADAVTLTDLQTATGQEDNALNGGLPYVSETDLHLYGDSPLKWAGESIYSFDTDFDGNARPDPPTIGAYEYAGILLAPVATAATSIDFLSFTANWEATSGATGYYLDVATDNLFTTLVIDNADAGSSLDYNVTGLSMNTKYYYRVRAYNSFGTSANSNEIEATTLDPVFSDESSNYYTEWGTAASNVMSGVVTQLKDYTQTLDATVSNEIVLDLNGHVFSGTGASTISSSKMFGLKNNKATGSFDAEIKFADGMGVLQLLPGISFGINFTTENSASAGNLQIGDGASAFSFAMQNGDERFSKVSQVKIKYLSAVSLSAGATGIPFDFVLDDGALLKLASTGTYSNTITSTTTGDAATAILQIGDNSAISASFTGTLTEYYGVMEYYNGSTLNLELATSSTNPFISLLGGTSVATNLIKKGGAFTIGRPSSVDNFTLSPHGILDLGSTSNTGQLSLQGNLYLTGYNDPDAGKIKYKFTKSGETISTNILSCSFGSILTDDLPTKQIDVSKHFVFDMDNLTGVSGQDYRIRIAIVGAPIALTGTPVPINVAPGWQNFSVTSGGVVKGLSTSVYLNATYLPCANPSDGGEIESAQAICLGSSAATLTNKTTPGGQTGTLEYQWQSSVGGLDFTDLTTGTYTATTYEPGSPTVTTKYKRLVKVTCESTWLSSNEVEITVNPQPTATAGIVSNVNCFGGLTGSVSVSVSGGTTAYSYSWSTSPVQTASSASGLAAGTYSVTVSDANGCTATSSAEITQPLAALAADAGVVSNVSCFGGNDGSVNVTVSGGTTNYSYAWSTSPVQTAATASGLATGTYYVTVTDGNNCTATSSARLTSPPVAIAGAVTGGTTICSGTASGTLTLGTHTGAIVKWQFSVNPFTTWSDTLITTSTFVSEPLTETTQFKAVVQSGGTCDLAYSDPTTVTVIATVAGTVTGTSPVCYGSTSGLLTLSGQTGSVLRWQYSDVAPYNSYTNIAGTALLTTYTSGNLTQTTKFRAVVKNGSCSTLFSTGKLITVSPSSVGGSIASEQEICSGTKPANLVLSGNTGSVVRWEKSTNSAFTAPDTIPVTSTTLTGATIGNLTDSTYFRAVVRSGACAETNSVYVLVAVSPPTVASSVSGPSPWVCEGSSSGVLTLSGQTGGVVKWQSGVLVSGTWTYTDTIYTGTTYTSKPLTENTRFRAVVQSGACAAISSGFKLITVRPNPTFTDGSVSTPNCYGADVEFTGNGLLRNINNTFNYEVTIGSTVVNGSKNAISDALGTATYSETGLGEGSYSFKLKSIVVAGCTTTISDPAANFVVSPQLLAGVNGSVLNVGCFGGNTGSIDISVSGGTPAYTYSWSTVPEQTASTATSLTTGTYTVTVTDNNGCSTTASASVTEPAASLSANAAVITEVNCAGGNTGSIEVSVSGGTSNYSYSWSTDPVQTTSLASGLTTGTYTVTVTDGNSCIATASATVVQAFNTLTADAGVLSNVGCFGGNSGSIEVSVSGGKPDYTYLWSTNPAQTSATATALTTGTYTVTVTDKNGCTATSKEAVNQPGAALTPTAMVVSNVSIYQGSDGSVTVSSIGGTSPYSYQWSTNPVQTTQTVSGLSAGIYSVTVTDLQLCSATSSTIVTQPTPPSEQARDIVFSNIGSSQFKLDWKRGNGNGCTVFITEGSTGSAPPVNNVSYPANTVFGTPESQIGTTGWYSVYDGTGTSVTVTGLDPTTDYQVHICEYKLGSKTYNTGSASNNPANYTTYAQLLATASVVENVSCNGLTDGSVVVSVSGGNPSYSYSWSTVPAQTASSATGLSAGTYTVTVTDGVLATVTSSITVTQPDVLTTVASVSKTITCYEGSDGSVTVSVSGGTLAYSYSWSTVPVQTTATATGLSVGTYSVTVTDANGCMATSSTSIQQPIQWWPELTGPTPVCQNTTGNVYTTDLGMTDYVWLVSAGGTITSGGTDADNTVTITWSGFGPQTVSVNYTSPAGCMAVAPKVKNVMVNIAPTPILSGDANVTQNQVITYSTPYNPGNTYSWNASHGNPELCFPYRNCLTLAWDFPCGIINPGFVRVTETNASTGCSTTVTKWITITP